MGLEAVRRGIPAVYLRIGNFLSTDPMDGFDGLKWTARSPEEMRAVLERIVALDDKGLRARQAAGLRYAALYSPLPDKRRLAPFLEIDPLRGGAG